MKNIEVRDLIFENANFNLNRKNYNFFIQLLGKNFEDGNLTIKDSNNKEGDIEIKISGLRKGEKLYEELLINSDSEKTKHPLIFKANEEYIKYKELIKKLNLLQSYLTSSNEEMVFSCLKDLVPEWEKS